ncbi:DUF4886 domain-containing protein [Lacticaseibacillus daqingensis]|uniref:DUF4886 domain-containing protein n=1 Tax=Lacticaseibacillus daqingensis TaxID=2486014 RepID=UPI0013DE5803|nr:DUF4886 domain-containing protein [Lacticaseibacillus daqingensis]
MSDSVIRILDIGNSYSQNATTYLHQLLAGYGVTAEVVNLYVGGCSLARHWVHYEQDLLAYELDLNGRQTDRLVRLKGIIGAESWDIIVTQQASHDSGVVETYHPYIENLAEMLHLRQPQAELWLHETWAYAQHNDSSRFCRYHNDRTEMYEALHQAYHQVGQDQAMPIIPAGTVIEQLRQYAIFDPARGGTSLYSSDGIHLHTPAGLYALASTWGAALCHIVLDGRRFDGQWNAALSQEQIGLIEHVVSQVVSRDL